MSRVFVSSTCYDLLDLRAELKLVIEQVGLHPVMSDDVDYFEVSGRTDSIETCLANVRTSQVLVCILSQRYGPSLRDAGYPDVSATHLEYREARTCGLPIHMFVRDRLEAEYSLSKKHKTTHNSLDGFQTRWVPKGNLGMFQLLDEHTELVKGSNSTNWYTLFSSSVDLKERVVRQLAQFASRATLARLLESGTLPILGASIVHWKDRPSSGVLIRNVGRVPALDLEVKVSGGRDALTASIGDLLESDERPVVLGRNDVALPSTFSVHFTTTAGFRVSQDFALVDDAYRRETVRLVHRSGFLLA